MRRVISLPPIGSHPALQETELGSEPVTVPLRSHPHHDGESELTAEEQQSPLSPLSSVRTTSSFVGSTLLVANLPPHLRAGAGEEAARRRSERQMKVALAAANALAERRQREEQQQIEEAQRRSVVTRPPLQQVLQEESTVVDEAANPTIATDDAAATDTATVPAEEESYSANGTDFEGGYDPTGIISSPAPEDDAPTTTLSPVPLKALEKRGWTQHITEEGVEYFLNVETGESQWAIYMDEVLQREFNAARSDERLGEMGAPDVRIPSAPLIQSILNTPNPPFLRTFTN